MKQLILVLILIFFQTTAFSQDGKFDNKVSDQINLKDDSSRLELRIFPNPTKIQKITLKMPTDEIAEIQLLNIIGKELVKKQLDPGIHQYELNLQDIPQGVYLIHVKTYENKAVVKKLLISGS